MIDEVTKAYREYLYSFILEKPEFKLCVSATPFFISSGVCLASIWADISGPDEGSGRPQAHPVLEGYQGPAGGCQPGPCA